MRFAIFLSQLVLLALGGRDLVAESPSEIYQRRVIPLLQSSKASSCSECHLQGVRLDDFLTADPKQSFAALRARGWIDMQHPAESKLLQFIAKAPEHPDKAFDRVRGAELEAIGQWIRASVADPESLNTPLPKLTDLKLDEAFILHARKDHVLNRFVDVIWSQFERCANCHSPDRNAKQVEKHGDQMSWIVPKSPGETLQLLEERNLINFDNANASLLKTKALGLDDHGGGVKFPVGGQTDREWGRFLEDYVALRNARYTRDSDLPRFDSKRTWRTGLHLRVRDLPNLPVGQYAVVLVHRIDHAGIVDENAIAIGEGRVSKDGTGWSSSLMTVEPARDRESSSSAAWKTLADGRYQLRWCVVEDVSTPLEKILATKPQAYLEIDTLWPPGHSNAKSLSFGLFRQSASIR
jgi:hypothetical protein